MPDVGDSVDRYLVEAVLGEGGMGRVYRALDPRLKRRVALKVLLAGRVDPNAHTDGSARMLREARAAAAFNHPNVVAIYDVGEVDGNPFIAMELITGNTLRTYVGDPGLDTSAKVAWLLDVARGLGAAHRAGLVHRDIKPDNVMVTVDGVVKILDFGIARRTDALVEGDAPPSATPSNVVVGTPQYMAPEQIRGEPLDGRADQFAWGVMAYELISGKIPWDRATGLAVVAAVLSEDTRPLSAVAPGVHARLEAAILRALMKSRDDRFATMEGLIEALLGRRSFVPPPSGDDVAFAATTAQPVVSGGVAPASGGLPPPLAPPAATEPTPEESKPDPVAEAAIPRTRARVTWRNVAGAAAAAALVAGGTIAWRAAHAPRTTYCLTFDETNDGPRCALPIQGDRVARRYHSTARVTELGGHTTRVEYVNFAGERLPREGDFEDDDDLRRDVLRAEDGHVRAIITRNANGAIESHEKWSAEGRRVDFVDLDGVTPRHASDSDRVTSIHRDLDAQGRVVRELYFGPTGRPRPNEEGVYGKTSEYGKTWGARVKVTDLGADGLPAARRSGAAIDRSTDDEVPGGRETSTYDVEDKPFADNGVFRKVQGWDAVDVTSTAVFGLHGEPAVGLGASVHEIRSTFNATTHVQVFAFKDEHGKPQLYRDRWFSAVRFTQDARGRDVLIESLDADGNRTLVKDGIAAARCTYDDASHEIRREHLDPSGAPMTGAQDGYARMDMKKDAHGNDLEERFFDEHGHAAPLREGVAIRRAVFDERDLPIATSNFDVAEKPVANSDGWASTHFRYDRLRNLVEKAYFGVDGRPTVDDGGVAVQRWTYDDNDDLVAVAYFDAAGAPTMYQGDYASKREKHDERGLVTEEEYLDLHGDRVLQRDGYASVKRTRDRSGDVVLESYLGRVGEPVQREGGYAQRKTSYDVRRRPTEVVLQGVGGAPVVGADGWAIERSVYDERGLLVRVDHEDAAGRPKLDKAGRASWTKAYDARLNVTEEAHLGEDAKPILARGGWATKKTAYDDRDEVTEESLLGAAGEPVVGTGGWALHRLRHDDFGDVIEESFFDAMHEPTTLRDATYASQRNRYDERRRLVEIAYLDASGAPAKGPDGAAVVRYERDTYGRAARTTYLDGAGVPTASNEGKTTVRTTYDDAGRPILELFEDAVGSAALALDGCAGHRTRYDSQGHEVERTCLGTTGENALGREGWAIRRTLHDARGNAVDEATYDASGSPRADLIGVARTKRRYDERDRLREVAVFGVDGKPAHDRRGVHVTELRYDEGGKQTDALTRDERGRPVTPSP
jgi:hypothetical protein